MTEGNPRFQQFFPNWQTLSVSFGYYQQRSNGASKEISNF
jgi:hypothetical protein